MTLSLLLVCLHVAVWRVMKTLSGIHETKTKSELSSSSGPCNWCSAVATSEFCFHNKFTPGMWSVGSKAGCLHFHYTRKIFFSMHGGLIDKSVFPVKAKVKHMKLHQTQMSVFRFNLGRGSLRIFCASCFDRHVFSKFTQQNNHILACYFPVRRALLHKNSNSRMDINCNKVCCIFSPQKSIHSKFVLLCLSCVLFQIHKKIYIY